MLIVKSNIKTIQNAVIVLNELKVSKCQHHNPQQWSTIRTSHMHVPVTVLKATEMKKARSETNIREPRTKTHEKIYVS